MERDWWKENWEKWLVINQYWIASPPHFWVYAYNIFVDETRVQVFYTSSLILLLIYGHLLKFFFFDLWVLFLTN